MGENHLRVAVAAFDYCEEAVGGEEKIKPVKVRSRKGEKCAGVIDWDFGLCTRFVRLNGSSAARNQRSHANNLLSPLAIMAVLAIAALP